MWVGHVVLRVSDVERSAAWWSSLGVRTVHRTDEIAIFELRGGTHLLLFPAPDGIDPGQPTPFDLMVDDVEATRAEWDQLGWAPTALAPAPGDHQVFTVSDPDGYVLTVFSTHVVGEV